MVASVSKYVIASVPCDSVNCEIFVALIKMDFFQGSTITKAKCCGYFFRTSILLKPK